MGGVMGGVMVGGGQQLGGYSLYLEGTQKGSVGESTGEKHWPARVGGRNAAVTLPLS